MKHSLLAFASSKSKLACAYLVLFVSFLNIFVSVFMCLFLFCRISVDIHFAGDYCCRVSRLQFDLSVKQETKLVKS